MLVALVNQGRPGEAEQRVRAALKSHERAGILWKILSVALLRQNKDALPALRRAAELLPNDAEAARNLGTALHERGQWTEAAETLRQVLVLEPGNPDVMLEYADSLRGLGRTPESIPLYQRALELDPNLAEAHNNLGNAFLEMSRHADAFDSYRQAMALKPRDPQISFNLGLALTGLGRREEAAESYRRTLQLNPNHPQALVNLGNLLRDLGDRNGAVPLYRRAVELDPRNAANHCNLGNVLFELRQIEPALASYRQSLTLQPDHAPAHLGMAFVQRQQRRPDEAEASCRQALAIDPHYAEALSFLGELEADRGRFAEAERLFQQVIGIAADPSFALASIATHRKMTTEDTRWLESARQALAAPLPLGQEISLRYALGKYFDDTRQYDSAFAEYRQANELTKRYGITYNRANLAERIDRITHTFDRDLFAASAPRASAAETPILIVGMPRSGTSLMEQILASHPAVFGAGEVTYWNSAYDRYREAELKANTAALNLIPELADGYLALLASLSGNASRVVDKMPANFMYAGLIHAAFPRARIIHMKRHPLDTCLSIYFQNFFNIGAYANDLDDLAHYYGEYSRITAYWRATLPPQAYLEVPYEDLVADQETWTHRVLEFAGLPWDPRCLQFHQTDRVVITASRWQVRQKIHATSAGRWRHYEKFLAPLRALVTN